MSAGQIDNTFNSGTGFDGGIVNIIEIDSNGKIYVGGNFTSYSGVTSISIIRLNPDGTIDTGFNSSIGFFFDERVESIIEDSNGKIYCGGNFTSYSGVTANRIIRLNPDGTIDTGFNSGTGFNQSVSRIFEDSNGKIVCLGRFTSYSGVTANQIIRLNSNGTIDNTFSTGTGFNQSVYSIIEDINGKFYVGGVFTQYSGVTGQNYIIRLNSNGTIDTGFGGGTRFNKQINKIIEDINGKIVCCGEFTSYSGVTANDIIRLNPDGTIDNTFSTGTGFSGVCYTIIEDINGKIYCGGAPFTSYSGVTANNIIRLNPDGTIDTGFDTGDGFNGAVLSIIEDSNGKIYVGGAFTEYSGVTANSIIRLETDTTPPSAPSGLTATGITFTTATLNWVNNSTIGDNVIQRWNGSTWVNVDTLALSATTYNLTGLSVNTQYTYRVSVLYNSVYYPSNSVVFTTLIPLTPPSFCETQAYTISATTCGNSDGELIINNTDYYFYYDFTLKDIDGNIVSFTGLTSGYYFLTATVKPAYWFWYGRDECTFNWIRIEDTDTPLTLVGVSVKPLQCQPFDKQFGRIFYNVSGLTSGNTYSFHAFRSDLSLYYQETGITTTNDFILNNADAICYWVVIRDEVTGCVLLIDNKCVPSVNPFSVGGIKKLWIASWSTDIDYNYWSTADDDFFLEFEDTSFFNSTKVKEYLSLSGGTIQWYEIPVLPKVFKLSQKLGKVRQGFIFTDTLEIAIAKANASKWKEIADIINPENKWLVVLIDANDNAWTIGYRHGATVNAYGYKTGGRGEDNGYNLTIEAQSENKILTSLDKDYITNYIL